ncbi:MAG: dihydroxyacetone kinase subunit L [Deltaproteobacteria bacterium]|jgi:dihydroxyacetone kinase-like protein|nr:dihydroxyacetone kinase subunit L [Deltaproteobacteria bacterium]
MTDKLTPDTLRDVLHQVAAKIIRSRDELCRLDSLVGDGDHGVGMGRGFTQAGEKLATAGDADLAGLLKTFGMGVVTGAGGASGPLFGGLFTEGAKALKGAPHLDAPGARQWWRAALEATQKRGGAKPGDKTMVDALHPAVKAMEDFRGEDLGEMFQAAAKAAWEGVEKTKDQLAGQGRSRYLGERALGHQDAGATSTAMILDVLAKACSGDKG